MTSLTGLVPISIGSWLGGVFDGSVFDPGTFDVAVAPAGVVTTLTPLNQPTGLVVLTAQTGIEVA